MSTDVAASILFGDLRESYTKQQMRVDILRKAAERLEAQFLASVCERATKRSSCVSKEERQMHEEIRLALGRTRLQLADEIKLLQWIRRRHNMASMDARVERAERTLSLLTTTFLANSEAVKANIDLVLDAVLSQNLFAFVGASDISAEITKRYSSAIHKWLARINSLATGRTSDARMAGVLLIKHTAQQSPQLFSENVAKWNTVLLSVLSKAEITPVIEVTLQTLLLFIDAVRDIPMLYREIVSAHVPRMNQAILAMVDKNTDLTVPVLEMLEHSATWFPTLFRPSIDKAEALCLRLLDGSNSRMLLEQCQQAARCLAAFSLAGGKNTPEERWFQCMQKAAGTMRQCVDHIMCVDANSNDQPQQQFALAGLSDDFTKSIPQAADRIAAMAEVIVALLTQPTPMEISVPADRIVDAASRVAMISMRAANSKSKRAEYDLIPLLTPQLQRASIRIMAALAISLGSHMQPFLSAVARTATAIHTQQIVSPTISVALHSLLRLFIERYGYGFVTHLPYDIIVSVVNDICVHKKSHAPSTNSTKADHTASKKRSGNGKSRNPSALNTDESVHTTRIHWNDTGLAALSTVLVLLQRTPTALATALRTRIDSQILTLLMLFSIGGIEIPFASRQTLTSFKVLLYRCLEASLLSPDPWQRAIIPHAISAFNCGLEDPSPQVQKVCSEALLTIDPIVHSRLPAQLREPDNAADEKQVPQIMSACDGSTTVETVLAGIDASANGNHSESMEIINDQPLASAKRFKPSVSNSSYQEPQFAAADSQPNHQPLKQDQPSASMPTPLSQQTVSTSLASTSAPLKLNATDKPRLVQSTTPSLFNKPNDPVQAVVVTDEDDDNIPDIVMEGSDSEDE
ncbi:hypothetical protein IWW36_002237 [Coemansia brasiliensis]|uniref:Pre-rRNA-processing protein RIX1 n=1 Tax=Coemansia brasiliensis TaxID=2650707 RepID=A0A9W8I9Z8_9FUNG|nr:hypothetical protein IWW36_002237 [Coemansia brasiliensis]